MQKSSQHILDFGIWLLWHFGTRTHTSLVQWHTLVWQSVYDELKTRARIWGALGNSRVVCNIHMRHTPCVPFKCILNRDLKHVMRRSNVIVLKKERQTERERWKMKSIAMSTSFSVFFVFYVSVLFLFSFFFASGL